MNTIGVKEDTRKKNIHLMTPTILSSPSLLSVALRDTNQENKENSRKSQKMLHGERDHG